MNDLLCRRTQTRKGINKNTLHEWTQAEQVDKLWLAGRRDLPAESSWQSKEMSAKEPYLTNGKEDRHQNYWTINEKCSALKKVAANSFEILVHIDQSTLIYTPAVRNFLVIHFSSLIGSTY
jgi:hypothetical protein